MNFLFVLAGIVLAVFGLAFVGKGLVTGMISRLIFGIFLIVGGITLPLWF